MNKSIKLEDLKQESGFDTLLEFLDKHLAKDDLANSLEKFEEFEDLKRSEGQSMNEFIAIFDSKYRKIEKKKMTLPSEILAFKLLRKANITKEQKMLVLTGTEARNCAVLDSACSSTVCGKTWLESYLSCITENYWRKSVIWILIKYQL